MQYSKTSSPDKIRNPLSLFLVLFVRFFRRLRLILLSTGKVSFGINSYIGKNADFYVPNFIKISNNVSIGSNCLVQVNLTIGSDSLISSNVSFIGNDHDLSLNKESAYLSGRLPPSEITLEGNNFIGFGSIILGNVTIGYGAIVGANSFVNKNVPPNTVVVGNPAKFLKPRSNL